ncbi:MAG: tRNA uridine-5-carboxymethylaminomethyl(34) synthesis GTPase MnmE [Lawsonibacter sp.]|nr:tRNA uridine-5-carboxymethylaminomethyl(34) synthesis GTPase MnmE [Lawsonibacter sp.]
MTTQTDTIAAMSTPPGAGAIGILRLSGQSAVSIAETCFKPLGHSGLRDHKPRELVYGDLLDSGGQPIDRVLCTYSLGPSSYTGEDTAEFHCHGSPMVLTLGLEALFAAGARQAGAGEFTRRAFLNGRLDLAQAEAVGDLLEAQSREGARHAAGQLAGALSRRIGDIYSALVDVMAHFHAVLDYPDEDIDPFRLEQLDAALSVQEGELNALLASCGRAKLLKDGAACAIVGRPNAGKSSLLNAMVGYDRAIVTDIPGTTRDTVEERVELGGVLLRLIDTAGLREAEDTAERLGVERSRQAMERAELILAVMDGAGEFTREDREALELAASSGKPWIWIASKRDLTGPTALWTAGWEGNAPAATVSLSARTGEGLEALERAVSALYPAPPASQAGALLTNARQAEAAGRAREAVRRGAAALEAGMPPDAVVADVEEAMSALGELTGRTVREDVTARIFARFCVGK